MCVRERVAHEGKLCADHDHDYEYEHEHVVKWASTSELVSKLVRGSVLLFVASAARAFFFQQKKKKRKSMALLRL